MQKGYPDTYDHDAITAFVADVRVRGVATLPVYSHATYDRVPEEVRTIEASTLDVVVIEGVNALQPPLVSALDLAVYLDAEEPLVRSWYVERFLDQIAEAETDESSFYRRFASLDDAARRALAEQVWEGVNLGNLVEHIGPSRHAAHVVLVKGEGHRVR